MERPLQRLIQATVRRGISGLCLSTLEEEVLLTTDSRYGSTTLIYQTQRRLNCASRRIELDACILDPPLPWGESTLSSKQLSLQVEPYRLAINFF